MYAEPSILILASLAEGDKHGYAMMDDIRQFTGISLGAGTLYGAITRLEQEGWIRRLESEERRKPYRITAAGRRYLQQELTGLSQVVRTGMERLKHA